MKRPLKLYVKSPKRNDGELEKQTWSISDQVQHKSNKEKVKTNGLEKQQQQPFDLHQNSPSLHEVLGPVLTVAQFFGNLPVMRVLDSDFRNVSFKWTAFRAIYALIFITVGAFEVCLMIFKGFSKGFNLVTVEVIMFYFDAVAQTLIFLHLATKWKNIIAYWSKMERPILLEPYKELGRTYSRKVQMIGGIFFVCFLIEHFMFIAVECNHNLYQLRMCNITQVTALNNYFRRERPHLLDVIPYYWWIFPIFQWTISLMAFNWNFVDYFIIILSLCLSTRFDQLNQRLRHTRKHQMDQKFWLDIRLHYTNLVDLVEFIDGEISLLVLFSMSHNLFLVCTKIFEAIKYSNRTFLIDDIYFYFYLFFLLGRTFSVLYACSSVQLASRYPLIEIRNTPSANWSINLKRLSDMIQAENITLSGGKFFFITRPMILALSGTIITFELVLLDRGSRDEGDYLCKYFKTNNLS